MLRRIILIGVTVVLGVGSSACSGDPAETIQDSSATEVSTATPSAISPPPANIDPGFWWRPVDTGTFFSPYCDFFEPNPAEGISGFGSGCWQGPNGWVFPAGLMLATTDPRCQTLQVSVLPMRQYAQEVSVSMLKDSGGQKPSEVGEYKIPQGEPTREEVVPIKLKVPKGGVQFKLDFAESTEIDGRMYSSLVSEVTCL